MLMHLTIGLLLASGSEAGRDDAAEAGKLVAMVLARDSVVPRQAAEALAKMGPAAVGPVLPLLDNDREEVRDMAVQVLAEIRPVDPRVPPALVGVIERYRVGKGEDDAPVPIGSYRLAIACRPSGAAIVGRLVPLLASPVPEVRGTAARALGLLAMPGDQAIADGDLPPVVLEESLTTRLAAMTDDPAVPARSGAILAMLGLVSSHQAVDVAWPALVRRIDDPDREVRSSVLFAFARDRPRTPPPPPRVAAEAAVRLAGRFRAAADADELRMIGEAIGSLGVNAAPALPTLIDGSRAERAGTREAAVIGLAMIGPEVAGALPPLRAALRDRSNDIRHRAAFALAKAGAGEVPGLIAVLDDPDDRARGAAALALGQIGPAAAPAVGRLVAHLGDDRTPTPPLPPGVTSSGYDGGGTPGTIVDSLGRIGAPAVEALVERLGDGSSVVRLRAAEALARMGPAATPAIDPLAKTVASDPDEAVRQGAAIALAGLRPGAAGSADALADALRDDVYRRDPRRFSNAQAVLDHLGRSGTDAAIAGLIATLARLSAVARLDNYGHDYVARALGRVGPRALPALIEALDQAPIHSDLATAFHAIGGPSVPPIVSALRAEDPGRRIGAADALATLALFHDTKAAVEPAIPALTAALADPEAWVRSRASQALERLKPPPFGLSPVP